MKTVVIADKIDESGFELLKQNGIKAINAIDKKKGEELYSCLSEASVIVTRTPTAVDKTLLDNAPKLEAVVRASVGVDNIDIEECSKRGIIVMNVPTANTIAAVELTMTHMLASARSFSYAHNHLKNDKKWQRSLFFGIELKGKKLGVIGFGNIGSRVATRAQAFDMDVIAYDPYIPSEKATSVGVEYTKNFDDMLKCDFITIHTPKNHETIDMISHDEISKMKDGVTLINVARGGLYNEDALYENLKSGKIRFLGIDVFVKEPAVENKLLELDNINVTPHLGGQTIEAQANITKDAMNQTILACKGVRYPNALNLPIKEDETPEFVVPYIELVQKLASISSQINVGVIKSIKLTAEGDISKFLDSLTTFALTGTLKQSMGERVNYVNATFVAKDRGIEFDHESKVNKSIYKNRLTLTLSTDNKTTSISGSVLDEHSQRIVGINDTVLDIVPEGKMIIFQNKDVPGVIAKVSGLLADEEINISDFRLGKDGHGNALAIVIVDSFVSKDIIEKIKELSNCIWVSYVVV